MTLIEQAQQELRLLESHWIALLSWFGEKTGERNRVLTPKDAQRLKATLGGSLPDDAVEQGEWGERAKRCRGAAWRAG